MPYFRFHWTHEDADEDGCLVSRCGRRWDCLRCRSENEMGDRFCWWCRWDVEKNSDPWECVDCNHVNPGDGEPCQLCGREMDE